MPFSEESDSNKEQGGVAVLESSAANQQQAAVTFPLKSTNHLQFHSSDSEEKKVIFLLFFCFKCYVYPILLQFLGMWTRSHNTLRLPCEMRIKWFKIWNAPYHQFCRRWGIMASDSLMGGSNVHHTRLQRTNLERNVDPLIHMCSVSFKMLIWFYNLVTSSDYGFKLKNKLQRNVVLGNHLITLYGIYGIQYFFSGKTKAWVER